MDYRPSWYQAANDPAPEAAHAASEYDDDQRHDEGAGALLVPLAWAALLVALAMLFVLVREVMQ